MHVEKIHNKLIEKCLNKSIKFGTYLAILFMVQIAYTKTNRLFLKPNPIYKEDSTSFYKEDAYVLMSGNAVKRSHSLFIPTGIHHQSISKPFHRFPSGTGAVKSISSFDTGWMKRTLRACRQMLPSGLERGNPYFKSPLIGHPIFAN